MILYTYQAAETIFPTNENDYLNMEMVDIPGGQLLLQRVQEDNSYRIVRLMSTDPYLYLDQRYQPGQTYPFQGQ